MNENRTADSVVVVRGEDEVWRRTAHLFERATTITCAANRLASWTFARGAEAAERTSAERASTARTDTAQHDAQRADTSRRRVRKLYRSGMLLLDAAWRQRMSIVLEHPGAEVRVIPDELNETIILDERLAILAGDERDGERSYSLITQRETVRGVMSLFESAWRSATDMTVYDADVAEIRAIAPQVLDLLTRGVKDETAARELGLGVRTYRRRVAELMAALGADSRFQAGVRARELGLV